MSGKDTSLHHIFKCSTIHCNKTFYNYLQVISKELSKNCILFLFDKLRGKTCHIHHTIHHSVLIYRIHINFIFTSVIHINFIFTSVTGSNAV